MSARRLPVPALFAFLCAAVGLPGGEPLSPSDRVGFAGVGAVRVGMSLEELRRAAGDVVLDTLGGDGNCAYASLPERRWGISWMLIDGRVARTDIDDRGFATVSGIRVGDPQAKVLEVYRGRVRVERHHYVETGSYLTVDSADGKSALVFETDAGRVTSYRIGRLPEAYYVEGCS